MLDDNVNPEEQLVVLDEPEGTISIPGEFFSTFFSEFVTGTVNIKFVLLIRVIIWFIFSINLPDVA